MTNEDQFKAIIKATKDHDTIKVREIWLSFNDRQKTGFRTWLDYDMLTDVEASRLFNTIKNC